MMSVNPWCDVIVRYLMQKKWDVKKKSLSCLCSVEFPARHRKVKTKAKRLSAKRAETWNSNLQSFD